MLARRIKKHIVEQNWVAVGLDFIIVVLGVAIALAGQQWLNERQQLAEMQEVEKALQIDLLANYFSALERISLAKCRKQTYTTLSEKLLESGETWIPIPTIEKNSLDGQVLQTVLRVPLRSWGSRTWESGLVRGTFNQMDDSRRDMFDRLFRQANTVKDIQFDIFTLLSRMKLLTVNTRISPEKRSEYYDRLGELDAKGALLEGLSSNIVGLIEEIGLELPDSIVSEALDKLPTRNASRKSMFGECFVPMEYALLSRS